MVDLKHYHLVEKNYYKEIFDAHDRIFLALKERNPEKASAEMEEHILDVQKHLLTVADTSVWEKPGL